MPAVADKVEVRFSENGRFNFAPEAKVASVKFLTPGLVSYKDMPGGGIELLRKETIDEALASIEGIPLTLDHPDDMSQLVSVDIANGRAGAGRFNADDGWYWCDTTVETDQAKSGIRRGLTPSIGYEVLEWGPGGVYQNIRYNKEIKKIRFNHLAIVSKPRYGDSIFRLNSLTHPDPTMKVFKLIKKIVTRTNGADGKEIETVTEQKSDVAVDAQLVIDGNPVRLNELGQTILDSAKAIATTQVGQDDEWEIDGQRVKHSELVNCYKNSRKNAADEEEKKKKEEAERKNALLMDEQKKAAAEEQRKNAAAEEQRKNEGKKAFNELRQAPINGGNKVVYEQNSGSISEQLERGRKRY